MTEFQILDPDLSLQKQAKQAGRDPSGRFAKGRSGNPAGRPAGIRNPHARQIARLRWNPELGSMRYAIDCARDGHPLAIRLCLGYMIRPRRSRPIAFDLPPILSAADLASALQAIITAAAQGEINSSDALELTRRAEKMLARAWSRGSREEPRPSFRHSPGI
jgi:hypothetical protein